ncbi:SRPBCC domain-containing protein [Streptomyces sp. NPDC058665]|uniref:SRPBCC family protein n=1 Tax=Streptomyces sp. NPDC058665 TaxID=3346586 RepID=UPI0036682DDE
MAVRQLRAVDAGFAESAPLRLVFGGEMSAPPGAVYRALAEETEAWPRWFTPATAARQTPGGHEIRLRMGGKFTETIRVAEPDVRYAYRVDTSNMPGPLAGLEDWRLTPAGTGTRVSWTFAADGSKPFLLFLRAFRPGMARAFTVSLRRLDRRLGASPAG